MSVIEINIDELKARVGVLNDRELDEWISQQEKKYIASLPTPETINNCPGDICNKGG